MCVHFRPCLKQLFNISGYFLFRVSHICVPVVLKHKVEKEQSGMLEIK